MTYIIPAIILILSGMFCGGAILMVWAMRVPEDDIDRILSEAERPYFGEKDSVVSSTRDTN